jgi:hypothetical protein
MSLCRVLLWWESWRPLCTYLLPIRNDILRVCFWLCFVYFPLTSNSFLINPISYFYGILNLLSFLSFQNFEPWKCWQFFLNKLFIHQNTIAYCNFCNCVKVSFVCLHCGKIGRVCQNDIISQKHASLLQLLKCLLSLVTPWQSWQ